MDDDFQIYFVKPDNNKENSCTLVEAFETLTKREFNFKPDWISQEECLKVTSRGKHVYIFDPFEGKGFDHIQSLGFRIYGPRCVLANLIHGMELPRNRKHPIYNLAMKGLKLCCTSIDKKTRDGIMQLAMLMGGEVACDLTADITHLIAGEVGSNKYLVASENGKHIMVKDWIHKVWEVSQERHILATDDMFNKYVCPAFLGLTIVVSGFTVSEKNKMRSFITHYGGKYSGELKMNECTHLIVKEPKGPKFEAAKNWRIRIVNERWLLDCVDKQKYLDPKAYQYNETSSTKVNTSTPERQSVLGPNINDISAITGNTSMSRVDETNLTTTRLSSMFTTTGKTDKIAETKLGVTSMGDNSTLAPADVFLDGCKIYLSGIKSGLEDKAKKIISAGGGLRALEIAEGITHVVVGNFIPSQMKLILKLQERPHIVTLDWLMECFTQNVHVIEDKYTCSDFNLELPCDKAKTSYNDRKSTNKLLSKEESKTLTEEKITSKEFKTNRISVDKSGFQQDAPSDLEMAELLSQYMEPPASTNMRTEETIIKVITVEDQKASQQLKADDMTQDPNDLTVSDDKEIFKNITFIVLGFTEDVTAKLTEAIIENGGVVIESSKKRKVSDIAIVPFTGCPVDVTVSEILTNAWLELCIENDTLVPYDGHWLNRPMELPDNEPLKGLCVTVSGYTGVERNWIIELAHFLGADCQDKFSRKSTKTVKANTHLIVNQPTGSKYLGAKKWNLPAVGKEWLLACVQQGKKVEENEYAVEILYQQQQDKNNKSLTGESSGRSRELTNTSSVTTPVAEKAQQNDIDLNKVNEKSIGDSKMAITVAVNEGGHVQDRVPASSGESSDSAHQNINIKNPMSKALLHQSESPLQMNEKQRKGACQPSQTDNISAGCLKTPASVMRQKWGINVQHDSPSTTPYGMIRGGGETPSTFMKPGFKPKFNLDGVFSSPETTEDLNKSTPWGETFKKHISRAAQLATAQNSSANESDLCHLPQSQSQHELPPLHGVIIAVAKKLGRSHEQYNNIVVELGGNYSWQMGQHVTHFVFQGRPNDTNKEFRNARDQGKIIVSPFWLFACKEQSIRVDESLFPHNYNPSFSLNMTPSAKSTPLRSSRIAAKSTHSSDTSSTIPVTTPVKAINRKMPVLNLQKITCAELNETESKTSPQLQIQKEVAQEDPVLHTFDEVNPSDNSDGKLETSTDGESVDGRDKEDKSKHREVKDALSKTMGNALASRLKGSLRKKGGKHINLSGQTSDGGSSDSPLTIAGGSLFPTKISIKEPSQSLQVTWGDPTERLEKEKLADRLEQVCHPSQNTEELMAAIEMPQENIRLEKIQKDGNHIENKFSQNRSSTPEPPPLAFPFVKPASHVQTPQAVELISEESAENLNVIKPVPVFIMSGLQTEERLHYSALVEQLGGNSVELPHFHSSCTHLIVAQPTRNEKCLSSVASGKWVLHKSYLEACRKEGKFVEESPHEWGSEHTLSLMQNMDTQSAKLAAAAHKWRKKIADIKKTNPSCKGAFDGWKVLLCLDRNKEDNFKRMLEAGGATVTALRSPFPENITGTHAFVDLNKVKIPEEDLEKLLLAEIHCLKAEYIPAFLMENPSPTDFYPEQIIALRACLSEPSISRKRRRGKNDSGSCSKMAKRL